MMAIQSQPSVVISMAAFALAACITPGASNIVALSYGSQFGVARSQRHALGSALGFTLIMVLTGFGLHEVLERWPVLTDFIRWAGTAFLLYLAWKLAADNGQLSSAKPAERPAFWRAATLQWLNPKGWMVAAAGIGAFAADGEASTVWMLCLICSIVCYVSVASWLFAGAYLRRFLTSTRRIRNFNRTMAAVLAGSAVSLLFL
ncbi:Cysteine/O-acetylserine efflux protein [Pseudomonas reidholzensis]|uniref:Cysteine/O-acetylserine efflux protein n=1 Tax=Pseudomonas reidholzensis TaxID=1785162 RepID=A0A383RU59_9PSED|nr:LysE family translocator [Pseudomonas reidholzensis]SYX90579.1 Cysteine/O-acetylserine efflux protein [Pseudomonas reidholzensis]